jgi:heme-degrading monooxygenase HmoA
MYTYIWRYRVRVDAVTEFLQHYRACGTWTQLFARARGYVDTQLLRDVESPTVFLTIDRWHTRAEHDAFRRELATEFERLDHACEALTEQEERLGDFETTP